MSAKSSAQKSLSQEIIEQINAAVDAYVEENPSIDYSVGKNLAAMRKEIAEQLKGKTEGVTLNAIQLMDPVNKRLKAKHLDSSSAKEEEPTPTRTVAKTTRTYKSSARNAQTETTHNIPVRNRNAPPSSTTTRRARMPATASANITSQSSTTSTQIKGLANSLKGICINVEELPYNANVDSGSNEFNADIDVYEVLADYVKIIAPEIAEELNTQTADYIQHLSDLHNKYPTSDLVVTSEKGKTTTKKAKPQSFKYATKQVTNGKGARAKKEKVDVVTYINPNDLKATDLPEKDAKPIIDYFNYLKSVSKQILGFSTPRKSTKAKQNEEEEQHDDSANIIDYLNYLQGYITNTPSVFNATWFKKRIPEFEDFYIKPLGIFMIDNCEQFENGEYQIKIPNDEQIIACIDTPDDIGYVDLFSSIVKIPTAKISAVAKAIYACRHKLITMLNTSEKKSLWFQAFNNINSITDEYINNVSSDKRYAEHVTKDDIHIIHAWQAILSSRYVYHVVMNGVPASPMFEKSFAKLISHPTSLRLFMSALYPIACVFTPFHCLVEGSIDNTKISAGVSIVTYNKYVKESIRKIVSANGFDFKSRNWLHYTTAKKETTNLMIKLLGPCVCTKSTKKDDKDDDEPLTASLKKKGALDSATDADEDDDKDVENEDGNEEEDEE